MARMRKVKLKSGMTIAYVEKGGPPGVPIVCLHGYGDSFRSFDLMIAAMPPGYRVIAYSHRGHANSGQPATGFGLDELAADAVGFLDALGIDKAILVGHSMGSLVAQRVAIDAPGRVLGLVLVGSTASVGDHPDIRQIWDDVIRHMTDPIDAGFVREFQTGTVAMPVDPAFMETVVAESLAIPARVWREEMDSMIRSTQARDLPRIAAPTLIVWGDKDQLFGRADQDALLAAIKDSRLVTYEGVGHGVQWEVPERTAAEVARFVRDVAATTGA